MIISCWNQRNFQNIHLALHSKSSYTSPSKSPPRPSLTSPWRTDPRKAEHETVGAREVTKSCCTFSILFLPISFCLLFGAQGIKQNSTSPSKKVEVWTSLTFQWKSPATLGGGSATLPQSMPDWTRLVLGRSTATPLVPRKTHHRCKEPQHIGYWRFKSDSKIV